MPRKTSGRAKQKKKTSEHLLKALETRIDLLAKRDRALRNQMKKLRRDEEAERRILKSETESKLSSVKSSIADSLEESERRFSKNLRSLENDVRRELREKNSGFPSDLQFQLDNLEKTVNENTRAIGMMSESVEDVPERLYLLNDQLARTTEVLRYLKDVLKKVETKPHVHHDFHPSDLTEIRLRLENLEKSLSTKETLKRLNTIQSQLESLDLERLERIVAKSRDIIP